MTCSGFIIRPSVSSSVYVLFFVFWNRKACKFRDIELASLTIPRFWVLMFSRDHHQSVHPKSRSFAASAGTTAAVLPKAGLPPQTQEPRLQVHQVPVALGYLLFYWEVRRIINLQLRTAHYLTNDLFQLHEQFFSIFMHIGRRVIGISGSMIWSKTRMELIFYPSGVFRWNPRGGEMDSQIHSPHLHAGAPVIFSKFFKICSDAKERVGCIKQREATAPIHP